MTAALCHECGKAMEPGSGCTVTHERFRDGVNRRRIPYGFETHEPLRAQMEMMDNDPPVIATILGIDLSEPDDRERWPRRRRCSRCTAWSRRAGAARRAAGQYHHPGCDDEQCPRCFGQALGCSCYATSET